MTVEVSDVDKLERQDKRRAREERIQRLDEEFYDLMRQNDAIFAKWRREGLLPPEEPRRRF